MPGFCAATRRRLQESAVVRPADQVLEKGDLVGDVMCFTACMARSVMHPISTPLSAGRLLPGHALQDWQLVLDQVIAQMEDIPNCAKKIVHCECLQAGLTC